MRLNGGLLLAMLELPGIFFCFFHLCSYFQPLFIQEVSVPRGMPSNRDRYRLRETKRQWSSGVVSPNNQVPPAQRKSLRSPQ